MVFGGSGVYDTPHVLTSVSEIFTDHRKVSSLTNFKTGRGTSDFFDAIRFAAKLPFQPGASKIFVALTCSIGESVEMRVRKCNFYISSHISCLINPIPINR